MLGFYTYFLAFLIIPHALVAGMWDKFLPKGEQVSQLGEALGEGMARGLVNSGAEHAREPLQAAKADFLRTIKEATPQIAATAQEFVKEMHVLSDKFERSSNRFLDRLFNKAHTFVYTVAGVTAASFIGYSLFKRWCDREKKYTLPHGDAAQWQDVIKPEPIKQALLQKIQFIKNVRVMHEKSNSCLYRALLLIGERGTGKSAIAQMIAKESAIPVVYISSAHFMQYPSDRCFSELYKLCADAMTHKECCLIIDSLDDLLSLHDAQFVYKLTQLLVEVIGAYKNNCMVIGITRDCNSLPATILQCFDDQLAFSLPDYETRKALLFHYRTLYNQKYHHILKQPLVMYFNDDAVDALAQSTEGFSGSKLESLVSELTIQVACTQC